MRILKLLLAVSLFSCSGYGYSIFDLQLFGGQRSAGMKPTGGTSSTITGSEMKAAAHLDPIPLVPIGFGLAATSLSFTKDNSKLTFDKITGSEVSFEVMAWIPKMIISLEPYVKVGYVLTGAYDMTAKANNSLGVPVKAKSLYKASGYDLAAGVTYSPLPLIGFILEADKRMETLKSDKITVDGITVPKGADIKNDSLSFLLGLEVGL